MGLWWMHLTAHIARRMLSHTPPRALTRRARYAAAAKVAAL